MGGEGVMEGAVVASLKFFAAKEDQRGLLEFLFASAELRVIRNLFRIRLFVTGIPFRR